MLAIEVLAQRHRRPRLIDEVRAERPLRVQVLRDQHLLEHRWQLVATILAHRLVAVA